MNNTVTIVLDRSTVDIPGVPPFEVFAVTVSQTWGFHIRKSFSTLDARTAYVEGITTILNETSDTEVHIV